MTAPHSPHAASAALEARYVAALAGKPAETHVSVPHGWRLAVARHEAAHAVALYVAGVPITEAAIDTAPPPVGMVMAGQFAQPAPIAPSPRLTAEAAGELCRRLGKHPHDLRRVLVCLSLDTGATWRTMRAEIARLREKARKFVADHWHLIRPLADELLVRSRMSGAEVSAFLDAEQAFRARRQARAERLSA